MRTNNRNFHDGIKKKQVYRNAPNLRVTTIFEKYPTRLFARFAVWSPIQVCMIPTVHD